MRACVRACVHVWYSLSLLRSGMLKVAEVKSRIEDTDDFCLAVCEHGFELTARVILSLCIC